MKVSQHGLSAAKKPLVEVKVGQGLLKAHQSPRTVGSGSCPPKSRTLDEVTS